jgi:formylglycine-generating enzyme required for sulfatase activity
MLSVSPNSSERSLPLWISIAFIFICGLLVSSCAFEKSLPATFLHNVVRSEDWVQIPAGRFLMGDMEGDDDEKPVHSVDLGTFWITRFEITNQQYLKCVQAGACQGQEVMHSDRAREPVVNVSWQDAQDFCVWMEGRLPTEAEWEKAARGGLEAGRYPWGDAEVTCDQRAENGAQFGYCPGERAVVGTYPANGYGLYDVAGNAWEWVADWYSKDYYQSSPDIDPQGPQTGRYKVLRGGGWNYTVYGLRVAYRSVSYPDSRANFIGFRCARTDGPT